MTYFASHASLLNMLGIILVLCSAWLVSLQRNAINYWLVGKGLLLHGAVALFMLKTNIGTWMMQKLAYGIDRLYAAGQEGVEFLFGSLARLQDPWGFLFAFQVLPVVIFFGAFMSILYYYGVIQWTMWLLYQPLRPLLKTSGAETLCAVSNSVLGQTEAPLLIKNYLPSMTRSEIMLVMVSGMGSISASVLAVYASLGVPAIHLLTANVMAVPAALIMAKIICPETDSPHTAYDLSISYEGSGANIFDAIAQGSLDGLQLVLNVGAILIAFIALISFMNICLAGGISYLNVLLEALGSAPIAEVTLQDIFGYLFAPVGWLLAVPAEDVAPVGQVIGIKLAVNEMVAFLRLVEMDIAERSLILATYALCGFANFSCIGLQIGGIGALAPQKRSMLSQLGLRALIGGTLANFLSAFVAALII